MPKLARRGVNCKENRFSPPDKIAMPAFQIGAARKQESAALTSGLTTGILHDD
jgi:hypothetical protein